MGQQRFPHSVSLNAEQEEIVSKAIKITGDSYADLLVKASRSIISSDEKTKRREN